MAWHKCLTNNGNGVGIGATFIANLASSASTYINYSRMAGFESINSTTLKVITPGTYIVSGACASNSTTYGTGIDLIKNGEVLIHVGGQPGVGGAGTNSGAYTLNTGDIIRCRVYEVDYGQKGTGTVSIYKID